MYLLGQLIEIKKLFYLKILQKAFALTSNFRIKPYLKNGIVLKMGIIYLCQILIFSS